MPALLEEPKRLNDSLNDRTARNKHQSGSSWLHKMNIIGCIYNYVFSFSECVYTYIHKYTAKCVHICKVGYLWVPCRHVSICSHVKRIKNKKMIGQHG